MSGKLNHTPARILQQLLIDKYVVTDPDNDLAWPCFHSQMPDDPDDAVAVYNTEGRVQGRTHYDKITTVKYGIQVAVRTNNHEAGYLKMEYIKHELEEVERRSVTIDDSTYKVQAVHLTSPILDLGKEQESSRHRYTLNAIASIRFDTYVGTGTGT